MMSGSHTNGTLATVDTSILDTPTGKRARSRLSFLKRSGNQPQTQAQEAVLAPITNGSVSAISTRDAKSEKSRGRGRDISESEHSLSGSKENQGSMFGVNDVRRSQTDDGEWVTQSDLTSVSATGGKEGRRSSSSQRPETATSDGKSISRVGTVRKRLSMLKLGKKSSKASVLTMSGVTEEE